MIVRVAERYVRGFGVLCPAVIGAGVAASAYNAIVNEGWTAEDFLNLPISALGVFGKRPWPELFNLSIVAGAILMLFFVIGLRPHLDGLGRFLGTLTGFSASIGLGLVGAFQAPSYYHRAGTVMAFLCLAMTGAVVIRQCFIDTPHRFPRWLGYLGLFAALSSACFAFALVVDRTYARGAFDYYFVDLPGKPHFNGVALLEWLAFFSLQLFSLLTAVSLPRAPQIADRLQGSALHSMQPIPAATGEHS